MEALAAAWLWISTHATWAAITGMGGAAVAAIKVWHGRRSAAAKATAKAIDDRARLVGFLAGLPDDAKQVLARFVRTKTHTLALDPFTGAVSLLSSLGVIVKVGRAPSDGYFVLHYYTVQAQFWQVMQNDGVEEAAGKIHPPNRRR